MIFVPEAMLTEQLLDGQAVAAGFGQNQPRRADRFGGRPMDDQAMHRTGVEGIAFQTVRILAGILEFPFQAIDLVTQCQCGIDQARRVGRDGVKIDVELFQQIVLALERRQSVPSGNLSNDRLQNHTHTSHAEVSPLRFRQEIEIPLRGPRSFRLTPALADPPGHRAERSRNTP